MIHSVNLLYIYIYSNFRWEWNVFSDKGLDIMKYWSLPLFCLILSTVHLFIFTCNLNYVTFAKTIMHKNKSLQNKAFSFYLNITSTSPQSERPLKPQFIKEKAGFAWVYIIFLSFCFVNDHFCQEACGLVMTRTYETLSRA